MLVESTEKAASFKKGRRKYEKEGNSFTMLKSTIMIIVGQRFRSRRGRKELKKGKVGGGRGVRKADIV